MLRADPPDQGDHHAARHRHHAGGQEASFYAITRFSIEQSDGVTAVSKFLRDETYRAFGCVQCELAVIPNFVNLAEYRPDVATPRDSLVPAGHKLLVHVSNFREVKRVKDVVRIFARLRRADAGDADDGGRRPRPERRRAGGARPRRQRRRALPRPARHRGAAARGSRPLRAALADRIVRAGGAGGDGLRHAGAGDRCRRAARSDHRRRGRAARAGRLGRGDGPARDRSAARTRPSTAGCAKRRSPGPGSFPPTSWCRSTKRSTSK